MAPTYPSISLGILAASLLIPSFLSSLENVNGYEGIREDSHVIKAVDLVPAAVCSTSTSTPKGINANTLLEVAHKYSPCSKHGSKQKAEPPTPAQILLQDQYRVNMIQSRFANASKRDQLQRSKATIPLRPGHFLGTGNYVVTVGIGSPKRDFSLVFDTGSDLTWIQCEPCAGSCYSQQEPIFNPINSTSYSNITCKTKECSSLKSVPGVATGCTNSSVCLYGIQYGDQSFSVGYFATETLTLKSSDKFNNFLFGCGENNDGLFGKAAGLLGMGRSKISMVSQTYEKYGGLFSYCLPSTSSSIGYLALGHKGHAISSNVKFTPLLESSKYPSFYFLDLVGMSVGGKKLSISASVFASPGTLIDSGTVITRLPPSAYSTLRSSFRRSMSNYPMVEALSILDTCYNFTGYNTVTIPKIALYFGGNITVDIDGSGVMYVQSKEQVCLAFAGNSDAGDIAILGNTQQKRLDVVYDVANNRIGFGPGDCN